MRVWGRRAVAVILLSVLAGVAFGGGDLLAQRLLNPWLEAPPNVLSQPLVKSQGLSLATVPTVVAKASPAVVLVTSYVPTTTASFNPFNPLQGPVTTKSTQVFLGSGSIISTTGYILTNQHVVNGANRITVTVQGYAQPFPARLIGQDYSLDLAVIKISAPKPLPVIPLAPSGAIQVGEWVVAIGNPYGLSHTVTMGVISATGRPISIPVSNGPTRVYSDLLQTDAAINPGNSGGPLLNLYGQMVGVNTAVASQAQGIGFAIPISTVRSAVGQLISQGYVTHAYLGVEIVDLTPSLAKKLQTKASQGAVVLAVAAGGPAQKAGIRVGDVIVSLGGHKVTGVTSLETAIALYKPGATVPVVVDRGFLTKTFTVTLAQLPPNL